MIRFSHPQFLLLLPLLWAFTWWAMRGSLADLGRERGRLAVILRLLLLTLLVLALSGLQFARPTHTLCTIFVVDVSDSIVKTPEKQKTIFRFIADARKKMHAGDQVALVAFGAESLLDVAPEGVTAKDIDKIVSTPSSSRTDIAAGIQLAMASFPQESGKQIVLFSDGNENLGSALDQTALAVSSDVRISVIPLERDLAHGEALLRHMTMPGEVKQGAPFQVSVVAEALQETDGTITLYRNNEAVETRAVHLKAGTTVLTFEQTVPKGGLYQFRAALNTRSGADTIADNNTATAFTRVSGKPKVLLVENTPGDGASVATALKARQVQVVTGGPDAIPASLAECSQYDSILFANVPAWRMSPAQMSIIRAAVRDTGMGFAMLGGDESFGAGGYYKTPIEDALPVTMDVKKQKNLPSMTLVIVIDVSGSMEIPENGIPKIKLAAEAAMAAVDLLQPIDQVCVIGYDTQAIECVKMTRVGGGKTRIYSQIEKLHNATGGGILIAPAMEEAYKLIRNSNSAVKHVIVCADAADTEAYTPGEVERSLQAARKMRSEKISLSVIGFGTRHDPDAPLQQKIVKANSGNWYLAERVSNLPQIFSRDVMYAAKSLLVEEPFTPKVENTAHPIMAGIGWGGVPPLKGYVAASFRDGAPSARLLLKSHKNDPVMAAWTYGLGRSLAFTSDASAHWGVHWLGWDGYSPFWTQAMRWTLRQVGKTEFQTTVQENHGRATITVDAVTKDGEFRNLLDLRAHVAHVAPVGLDGPQTTEELVTLEQTAPGRYEASFETRKIGPYVVTVEERNSKGEVAGMQMSTLVIPYSPEFQSVTPNRALLTQIAERAKGEVDPKAMDIFGRLRFGSKTLHDLWPLLLFLITLLFLFDITVRRVLLPWSEITGLLRDAIRRRLPAWGTATTGEGRQHSPVMGTLLGAKGKVPRPSREEAGTTARLRAMREQTRTGETPTTLAAPTPDAPPAPTAAPPPSASEQSSSTAGRLLQKKRERGEK